MKGSFWDKTRNFIKEWWFCLLIIAIDIAGSILVRNNANMARIVLIGFPILFFGVWIPSLCCIGIKGKVGEFFGEFAGFWFWIGAFLLPIWGFSWKLGG